MAGEDRSKRLENSNGTSDTGRDVVREGGGNYDYKKKNVRKEG